MDTAVLLTLLHGNENNTVSTFGAVQGSSGSALQDSQVLDILNVDVCQAVALDAILIPEVLVVGFTITNRNTVHYDKRLIGSGNGTQTTYVD